MNLRIVSWNVKRAHKEKNLIWAKILSYNADILLLQEVVSFPKEILEIYEKRTKMIDDFPL